MPEPIQYVFDLETNGYFDQTTMVHCLAITDHATGETYSFTDNDWDKKHGTIQDGLSMLSDADDIIGHNVLKFDLPVLRKLFNWVPRKQQTVIDTLIVARLAYPHIKDIDAPKIAKGELPGAMLGRHSLEAWGHRLGSYKGDYAHLPIHKHKALDKHGFQVVPNEDHSEFTVLCIQPDGTWSTDGMEWEIIGKTVDFTLNTAVRKLEIEVNPFETWNEDMQLYCEQDTAVTNKLFYKLKSLDISNQAVWLEHEATRVCEHIERCGFYFDREKAEELYQHLHSERVKVADELIQAFGSWWAPATPIDQHTGFPRVNKPTKTMNRAITDCEALPPRMVDRYHKVSGKPLKPKMEPHKALYSAGSPHTPIMWQTFDPGSRDQVAKRLITQYNWEPTEFTDSGKPKVTDETLDNLQHIPECALLQKYYMLTKRIGQLAEGNKAWLTYCDDEGFLRGQYNVNGAVTGRATHNHPNISQVPAADAKVPYGLECRSLFKVPDGWILLGSDLSGLELRCLGHFMAKWDDGAYLKQILEGDIHWLNTQALGLVKEGEERDEHNAWHNTARNKIAKTFIYAFLYGCGDEKAGRIFTKHKPLTERQIKLYGNNSQIASMLVNQGRVPLPKLVATIAYGRRLKARFLKALPALANLSHDRKKPSALDKVLMKRKKDPNKRRMWLSGLDGRELYVRKQHSALNTLLQSAGALICKLWIVLVFKELVKKGYKPGYEAKDGTWITLDGCEADFAICAWSHDEINIACRPHNKEGIEKIVKDMAVKTGEFFEFKAPVEASADWGQSWADVH